MTLIWIQLHFFSYNWNCCFKSCICFINTACFYLQWRWKQVSWCLTWSETSLWDFRCEILHRLWKHRFSELKPDGWRVCKYTNRSGVVRAAAEHVYFQKGNKNSTYYFYFYQRWQQQTFHVLFRRFDAAAAAAAITLHFKFTPNSLNRGCSNTSF